MRKSLPPRIAHQGVQLLAGDELVRPMLSATDQQLLDDHRQCGHFLIQDNQSYSYIVTINRKINFGRRSLVDFVVSELLHFSSSDLASPHWEPLCQLIASHERSHGVIVDQRLCDKHRPNGLYLPFDSYFMSPSGVDPKQIDSLYTELSLLDLPLYV